MYFQIFCYCLTISQWCKSVFRVVVVSLYFICNRNSNRPALLTLLTRLGHGWLRWGGAGRVWAGRGVSMLQCYREMAARARSPDISGDQWPGEMRERHQWSEQGLYLPVLPVSLRYVQNQTRHYTGCIVCWCPHHNQPYFTSLQHPPGPSGR